MQKKLQDILKEIKEIRKRLSEDPENLDLKRRLYKKKIEAIDLIKQEKTQRAISAKELLAKGEIIIQRYATNIPTLDKALDGGIPLGDFIQLAGASGAGKTSLALKIMSELSKKEKVVHFDFEMGEFKLAKKLKKYLLSEQQLENYLIDFSSYKLDELINEIELYSKEGIKFFLIDSKMKIEVPGITTAYDVSRIISKELQRLTRENNITIILINQLSESAIKEGIATLKGGNDQKYDSDTILILYKYYPVTEENMERKKNGLPLKADPTRRQLFIAKNRLGEDEKSYDIYIDELAPTEEVKELEPEIEISIPEMELEAKNENKINDFELSEEDEEFIKSLLDKEGGALPF